MNKTKGCLIANFATVPLQPVWPLIFASNITRSMPALGVKLPAKKIAAIKGVVYIICIVRYR
ncbi:hypothetical protein [Klebsiella michiganensis]|uniref:hypothetical protein n=1 Tax=Klebsiella michiganensis TaxID=1134687 RepID=UPI001E5AF782|nr:hypothetical protein [Klebsiella michiganensis]